MDLGAYIQIDDLKSLMKLNGIEVPRLRGLRLMRDEEPNSEKDIKEASYSEGVYMCHDLCTSVSPFEKNSNFHEFSHKTDRICKKYLIFKDSRIFPTGVKWKNIHGKYRKMFRFVMKTAEKKVRKQYETFNKYCGREDVLYIHARIGGDNWTYFGGEELVKQPWFIEKVDDAKDCTYCDIYAKLENYERFD